jgi:hypothetical protein
MCIFICFRELFIEHLLYLGTILVAGATIKWDNTAKGPRLQGKMKNK